MSAGFTPGPWASDATVSFSDRPDLPCVVDQHRLIVAQCWDDGHSEDECEANARLIAAAPDLLEALEYMLRFHRSGGHEGNADTAMLLAITATQRARGDTPETGLSGYVSGERLS